MSEMSALSSVILLAAFFVRSLLGIGPRIRGPIPSNLAVPGSSSPSLITAAVITEVSVISEDSGAEEARQGNGICVVCACRLATASPQ
jgi:hypothetical protein